MLRQAVLVSLALIALAATATAADMAGQGRIGALFEQRGNPAPRVVSVRAPEQRDIVVLFPRRVPGYYGTPTSFQQRNYYGTGHNVVHDYLPYVCEALDTCWNSDRH